MHSVNQEVKSNSWMVTAVINNCLTDVCLDTGAEANLLSHAEFKSLGLSESIIIKPTSSRLTSYGGTIIPT